MLIVKYYIQYTDCVALVADDQEDFEGWLSGTEGQDEIYAPEEFDQSGWRDHLE